VKYHPLTGYERSYHRRRAMSRNLRIPSFAAALAATVLLVGAAGASAATPPNPTSNIAPGRLPASCAVAPNGVRCLRGVVSVLDAARQTLGLGAYALPSGFYRLSGVRQLLVLANLDRVAYGLPPIAGLSPQLDSVAAAGVSADADPDPSAVLASLPTYGWASNWAGSYPNAPEAYYAWMYYDGWGGKNTSNIDCTSPTATGCWGHREDVLAFPQAGVISMGAAVSRDAHGQLGYAMTIVWTPASSWTTYSYSWLPAQAASAKPPS
jgi:hypothetical protein